MSGAGLTNGILTHRPQKCHDPDEIAAQKCHGMKGYPEIKRLALQHLNVFFNLYFNESKP